MDNLAPAHSDRCVAIAQRIIAVRKASGLNQTAFADSLGFPRRTYLGWERAESMPPVLLLDVLDRLYGIDPLWLLRGPDLRPRTTGYSIDWDRLERLVTKVTALRESLGMATDPPQALRHARTLFVKPPKDDEENVQALRETLSIASQTPTL